LKCCLNYELETYLDALSDIPTVEKALQTEKGNASLQKTDIFRRIMWFSYNNDSNWHSLPMSQVVEIMKMNEKGLKPNALNDMLQASQTVIDKTQPRNTDLDRLDRKFTDKNKKPNFQQNQTKPQNQGFQNRDNQAKVNTPIQTIKTENQNPVNKENQLNKGNFQQNKGNQPNKGTNQPQQNKPNPQNQGNKPPFNKGNNPNQGNKPNNQNPQNQAKNPNQGNKPNE
jgi:hypothetical protein